MLTIINNPDTLNTINMYHKINVTALCSIMGACAQLVLGAELGLNKLYHNSRSNYKFLFIQN